MKCICCQSDLIVPAPFKLKGYLHCRNCHFLFKPDSGLDDGRQKVARHYEDTDPHANVAKAKRPFFDFTLNQLPDPANKNLSLLDVGCGYGYFLDLAARRGWQTTGVEIVERAVNRSKEIAGYNNVFHGTLKEASFHENSFDVITLWDVIVYVEDPAAKLDECYRILKGGGKIGIRLRNSTFQKMLYSVYQSMQGIFIKHGIKSPVIFNRYSFSKDSIYYLLTRLGYRNIRIENSPLTRGNPYGYADSKSLVKMAKYSIEVISKILSGITNGRWLSGPSLLVWAEKPGEINGR